MTSTKKKQNKKPLNEGIDESTQKQWSVFWTFYHNNQQNKNKKQE